MQTQVRRQLQPFVFVLVVLSSIEPNLACRVAEQRPFADADLKVRLIVTLVPITQAVQMFGERRAVRLP